eukprot:scaffold24793_cov108-Cylindrotheca_fusiformis.AAC.3
MRVMNTLPAILVLLSLHFASSADDECATSNLFECPSETCGGTILVKDCLDCDGYMSTDSDSISMACGVGGGGIYVPLGMLLLNFAPKPSSGLSQASIFGASLGGLALNLRNKHPFTIKSTHSKSGITFDSCEMDAPPNTENVTYHSRPLIDYDMALFLSPMGMAGAVLGVIIQKLLPNWLYLSLAAIILGFTAYKTYRKFWDTREKEKKKRAAAEALANEPAVAEQPPLTDDKEDPPLCDATATDDKNPESSSSEDAIGDVDEAAIARCEELLVLDSRQFPKEKLFALFVLWIGLVLLTFFKGVKQTEEKKKVGYPFHPQDVLWDFSKTRFYAFFTFLAGIVAGLIGIGGGMVLGPLMLIMGVHPQVSTATNATMVILTSSSVAVLFVTAGLVPWAYAVTFFSVCLVGAYIGKKYIDVYVKKTGKASILIFMLATIIALAAVGCVVVVLTRLASENWCLAEFNEFCSLKEDDGDEDMCIVNRLLGGHQYGGNSNRLEQIGQWVPGADTFEPTETSLADKRQQWSDQLYRPTKMTSIRSIGLNFRNDPTLQNARSLSRRASRFASAKSTSRRSRLLDSEKQNVAKKVLPFIVSTRSRHQVSVNSKHGSEIGGKTGIFQVPLTVSDVHLRHEQLPFAYFFRETLDAVSLKDSLCRVLEHFPVVSGRIRSQNFQEIECNPLVDSVPLAFGDMDTTLDTWLSESRGHSHISGKGHPELLPIFDPLFEAKRSGGSNELENDSHRIRIPFPYDNLLRIRVTYFQCGGTAIGVNFLHALGDTASCVRFVQCWGREMQRMHYPRGASNARAGACVSGMMTKDLADLMGLLQDLAIADEKDQTSLSWMGLIADLFVSEKSPIESSLTSLETAKSYVYDEGNQHEYLQLRFTPEVLDAMREVALIAIARNERLSGKPEEMHRSF